MNLFRNNWNYVVRRTNKNKHKTWELYFVVCTSTWTLTFGFFIRCVYASNSLTLGIYLQLSYKSCWFPSWKFITWFIVLFMLNCCLNAFYALINSNTFRQKHTFSVFQWEDKTHKYVRVLAIWLKHAFSGNLMFVTIYHEFLRFNILKHIIGIVNVCVCVCALSHIRELSIRQSVNFNGNWIANVPSSRITNEVNA